MLRIEEGSHLDVDSPYFAALEQSSNGMGNRGKAMGMNSDLSTPPEYVVNDSGRALLGQLPLIRGARPPTARSSQSCRTGSIAPLPKTPMAGRHVLRDRRVLVRDARAHVARDPLALVEDLDG